MKRVRSGVPLTVYGPTEVIVMPGVGISVVALAVGAILDFAVTASPYRGWNGIRRHQTVIDDGHGAPAAKRDRGLRRGAEGGPPQLLRPA